ncbi:MAG: hypothetical protein O3C21_15220 [Verrucomicrobia bacterium]|nr:hypothetical protein [Verrucomicrobiota bacterium]
MIVALAIGIGAMVAAFGAWENFRGKHAWDVFVAEVKLSGERLELEALIPETVPDADNFAAIPLIQELFDKKLLAEERPSEFLALSQTVWEIADSRQLPVDGQLSGSWRTGAHFRFLELENGKEVEERKEVGLLRKFSADFRRLQRRLG